MVFLEIVILFTLIITIAIYTRWRFSYWKRKNIPYLPPKFPFGNMENPLTRKFYFGEWIQMLYNEFKKLNVMHGGMYVFMSPNYVPIDPDMIKNIMQKDFQYFVDRGFYHNEKDDPLSAHLFAIGGQKWRTLRTKLTPTFTSGKMKMMFDTLTECAKPMQNNVNIYCGNRQPIDIKDVLARFTTDVIGSCAFGLDCNSFKSDEAEFRKHGSKIFEPKGKYHTLKLLFAFARPEIARKLGFIAHPQESTNFFMNAVKDTVNYRESSNFSRKDMLQILIDLKHESIEHGEKTLTIEEIAAQAFVFFLAGFETSSTTMTFCLYELATNLEIQNKVREEVANVLAAHGGKITYEAIMEMKYMNQVIDETLRKYPPVAFLTRQCVKNYLIPKSNAVIEKGTMVMISVLGLHRDPEYYEDPDKFEPERFSEINKNNIRPFTYIPFGEGPRLCLGLRFGMMQTKVGLASLLKNYRFSVNRQTKIPFVWDKFSFILTTETPIWLDVQSV